MSTGSGSLTRAGLVRVATAGSVDDGKSTLIGRLLYDSKSILEDQLAAVERDSLRRGLDEVNLALLTDGLRAEREQGITIAVAFAEVAARLGITDYEVIPISALKGDNVVEPSRAMPWYDGPALLEYLE